MEKSKGLGDRFKTNLKISLAAVVKNPFAHAVRYDEVRFAVPKKFPYAAHYVVDEQARTIIIYAVLGFAENPGKWMKQ